MNVKKNRTLNVDQQASKSDNGPEVRQNVHGVLTTVRRLGRAACTRGSSLFFPLPRLTQGPRRLSDRLSSSWVAPGRPPRGTNPKTTNFRSTADTPVLHQSSSIEAMQSSVGMLEHITQSGNIPGRMHLARKIGIRIRITHF